MSGIVGANQTRNVLKISWQRNQQSIEGFTQLTAKFSGENSPEVNLVLCYCSVFDKCWITNSQETIAPQETPLCKASQVDPVRRLIESI